MLETTDEAVQQTDKAEMYLPCNEKVVFIGGKPEVLARLKAVFKESVFISDEAVTVPQKIDLIVMFPQFMNHVLFYKYISIARERDIKVTYCNGSNMDVMLQQIGRELK